MKIIQHPHTTLRKKAQPIGQITPKITALAHSMLTTLVPQKNKAIGVGLSANQVNKLHRLFVYLNQDKTFEIILNPVILKSSRQTTADLKPEDQFNEGCLSIIGYWGFVNRPLKIKAQYQTLTGLRKTKVINFPHSIYFQHELDHLNGVLFIDHVKKQGNQLYKADSQGTLTPANLPLL